MDMSLHCVYTTEASSAFGHVYAAGAWTAPGLVWKQMPVYVLDLSTQQRPVLHFDVSTLWRPVRLLELSTLQYRGLSCTWTFLEKSSLYVLLMCYSQVPEHQMISTLERPVLLLEVSSPQQRGLSCTWTCLDNSSLFSSWTYLHYRYLCCTRTCLHTRAWASPGFVCTTKSCAASGRVSLPGPELHLDVSGQLYSACAAPGLIYIFTTDTCAVLQSDVSTHYRVLCCIKTCFQYSTGALAAPGCVYTIESCAAPRRFIFFYRTSRGNN